MLASEQKRVQSLNDKLSDMMAERRELEGELDTLKFRVTEAVSKRTEMEATLSDLEKKVMFPAMISSFLHCLNTTDSPSVPLRQQCSCSA